MPTRHRQIEAFRFVMMSGTTTEAATLMSVSQPAISRLISDLEAELNIRLFDRFRGRLVPTEEARRFFHGVERYFVGLDELAQVVRIGRADVHVPPERDHLSDPVLVARRAGFEARRRSTGVVPRVAARSDPTNDIVNTTDGVDVHSLGLRCRNVDSAGCGAAGENARTGECEEKARTPSSTATHGSSLPEAQERPATFRGTAESR